MIGLTLAAGLWGSAAMLNNSIVLLDVEVYYWCTVSLNWCVCKRRGGLSHSTVLSILVCETSSGIKYFPKSQARIFWRMVSVLDARVRKCS